MASPQTENGFIKIANDLWNEILRRDFSKRQLNVVLLIWRLSYGCGQKDCVISKYNVFELAGLYKGDIKKELKYLSMSRVILWDEEKMTFAINKDYDFWQISPSKNWDQDKLLAEIATNLKRKKVSKTLTDEKEEVSKTLTNVDIEVSETLTPELVKHELEEPSTPTAPTDSSAVNTVLNTLNNKDNITTTTKAPNAFEFYEQNFGMLSPHVIGQISGWLDDFNEQHDILIYAMGISVERDKRNWGYTASILKDWFNKKANSLKDCEALQAAFKRNAQTRTGSFKKPIRQEQTPEWFEDTQEFYKPKEDKTQEVATAKNSIMDKLKAFRGES